MLIKLLVKEGPRKGDEFIIKGNVIIGRSRAELSLRDSKVSGEHAKITFKGSVIELEDLNSSNGTFLNDNRMEGPRSLFVGDILKIGRSVIEVTEISGESPLEQGSWQADVDKALIHAMEHYEKYPPKASAFNFFEKPVCLEVIKGPDLGEKFIYSYGPRKFGAHCSDGHLLNEDIPPLAFELVPSKGRCVIVSHSEKVKLNSNPITSDLLQEGDCISVGQTELVVKFVNP